MRRLPVALPLVAFVAAACSLEVVGRGRGEEPGQSTEPALPAGRDGGAASGDPSAPPSATTPPQPENCDVDGDGHESTACGGDDCCDTDPDVYPGAKDFHGKLNACGTWDYDCDGLIAKETPVGKCTDGFFSCSGEGFEQDTACGADGTHFECGWLFGCAHDKKTSRPQRCK